MKLRKLKIAPLPSSFMLTAIIGFLVSVIWVGKHYPAYGFAFALVFGLMFIASMISMTYAPVGDELQIDMKRLRKKEVKVSGKRGVRKREVVRKKRRKKGRK